MARTLALLLLLAGINTACAPLAGGAAAIAVTSAPQVLGALTTGVTVLSDTAKLACAVQSFANTENLPNLSHDAGILCSW